jgi:hypothetical protein
MNKVFALLTASIAVAVAGCGQVAVFGHTVGESKSSPVDTKLTSTPEAIAEFQKVRAVSVVLTEQVAAQAADDAKFKVDALLTAVKSELQSREALDESNAQVTAVAEIAIDDYALHPTSNVILFGQIISTGVLKAKARVSIAAKGETENPLGPLYREFAIQTGNTLTGKIIKPVTDDSWRPR